MPEGPEISYMVDNIQSYKNKKLKKIIINKYSKYYKKNIKHFNKLKKNLPTKILKIYNVGKRIFIKLDNGYNLIFNMGMSGRLTNNFDDKYNSMIFIFENKKMYFNDLRKFGTLRISKNIEKYENEMGYDPIRRDISFSDFYKKYIENNKSKQLLAIKLLDQKIFAGLGNYIRAEILYDTKIDPFCKFNKIPKNYWKKIYNSYKKISLSSYNYNYLFKAYQRIDKSNIIAKKVNNRTLWYDPNRIKYKC